MEVRGEVLMTTAQFEHANAGAHRRTAAARSPTRATPRRARCAPRTAPTPCRVTFFGYGAAAAARHRRRRSPSGWASSPHSELMALGRRPGRAHHRRPPPVRRRHRRRPSSEVQARVEEIAALRAGAAVRDRRHRHQGRPGRRPGARPGPARARRAGRSPTSCPPSRRSPRLLGGGVERRPHRHHRPARRAGAGRDRRLAPSPTPPSTTPPTSPAATCGSATTSWSTRPATSSPASRRPSPICAPATSSRSSSPRRARGAAPTSTPREQRWRCVQRPQLPAGGLPLLRRRPRPARHRGPRPHPRRPARRAGPGRRLRRPVHPHPRAAARPGADGRDQHRQPAGRHRRGQGRGRCRGCFCALGVRGTGRSMSRRIARHFATMDHIRAADAEAIQQVEGIGTGEGPVDRRRTRRTRPAHRQARRGRGQHDRARRHPARRRPTATPAAPRTATTAPTRGRARWPV